MNDFDTVNKLLELNGANVYVTVDGGGLFAEQFGKLEIYSVTVECGVKPTRSAGVHFYAANVDEIVTSRHCVSIRLKCNGGAG
jgi:hypothetical protein